MFAAHRIYYSTPEQKSQYFDVDFGKRECGIMGWEKIIIIGKTADKNLFMRRLLSEVFPRKEEYGYYQPER